MKLQVEMEFCSRIFSQLNLEFVSKDLDLFISLGIQKKNFFVICIVNVRNISLYFSLQNNKCVCDIGKY